MKLSATQRRKANAICHSFSGWKKPEEIRLLWESLSEIGIEVGMLTGRKYNSYNEFEWEIVAPFEMKNGDEFENCENSCIVYQVYEDPNHYKNEYNIYFS